MEHITYGREVAKRVAAAIDGSGLSLREVASRTGIAVPTLHRKKNGGPKPFDVDELHAIAQVLEVRQASFYPDEVA